MQLREEKGKGIISERKSKRGEKEKKKLPFICLEMGRKGEKKEEVILCLTCKEKIKEK